MWQTSLCACVLVTLKNFDFYFMSLLLFDDWTRGGKNRVHVPRYNKRERNCWVAQIYKDTLCWHKELQEAATWLFPLTCTSKWWLSTAVGTTIMVETSVGSESISPPCQSTIMWSRGLKTTIWEQHWGLWFKPVTVYCTWCSCPVSCILITLYYPQKFEICKFYNSTVGVTIFLKLFFRKGLCMICANAIVRNFNISICNVGGISQN